MSILKNLARKTTSVLLIAALAAASLTACGSASQTQSASGAKKVTLATKGGPAPYMVVNEDGSITGCDLDIINAIFAKLPQYELEIVKVDDPLTGLTSGLYDLAANNYAWREERGELYYFSLPYRTGYDVFIQRAGDEPLTGLQDVADRGYKTEVGAGSNKALALEKWNEENPDHQIELIYAETDFQMKFQNIADGKTDVAIDDGPILDALIGKFGLEEELVGNPINEETQNFIAPENRSYILFPKTEEAAALREDINKAIVELKNDGTLAKITEQYFGKDVSPDSEHLQKTLN